MMAKHECKIGEELLVFDEDDAQVGLDLVFERTHVAAQMAYWGAKWAQAEKHLALQDLAYRKWRGEATQALLEQDAKMAEWKAHAVIDGTNEFAILKERVARAQEAIRLSQTTFLAFKEKAQLVRASLGRDMDTHAVAGAIGEEPSEPSSPERGTSAFKEGVARMRQMFD